MWLGTASVASRMPRLCQKSVQVRVVCFRTPDHQQHTKQTLQISGHPPLIQARSRRSRRGEPSAPASRPSCGRACARVGLRARRVQLCTHRSACQRAAARNARGPEGICRRRLRCATKASKSVRPRRVARRGPRARAAGCSGMHTQSADGRGGAALRSSAPAPRCRGVRQSRASSARPRGARCSTNIAGLLDQRQWVLRARDLLAVQDDLPANVRFIRGASSWTSIDSTVQLLTKMGHAL